MTKKEVIRKMELKDEYNRIKKYGWYRDYRGGNPDVLNVDDLKYNINGMTDFLAKFVSLMQEYNVKTYTTNGMIDSFYIGDREKEPNSVTYFGASNLWTLLRKDEKELENNIEEAKKEMAEKEAKRNAIKDAIAKDIPADKKDVCDCDSEEECELCEDKDEKELEDTIHGAYATIHFDATPIMNFNFTCAPQFNDEIECEMYLSECCSKILRSHYLTMLNDDLSLCVTPLNETKTSYKLEYCECNFEMSIFTWVDDKESIETNKNVALEKFNETIKNYEYDKFLTNINNIKVVKIEEN